MKKVLVLIIFACLLAQCLLQLGVIGWYELNKGYIARNLCENKDKPQLHCCGKCYLRKQLKKANDLNAPSPKLPAKTDKSELVVFILPAGMTTVTHPLSRAAAAAMQHPKEQHMYGTDALSRLFRPPGNIC